MGGRSNPRFWVRETPQVLGDGSNPSLLLILKFYSTAIIDFRIIYCNKGRPMSNKPQSRTSLNVEQASIRTGLNSNRPCYFKKSFLQGLVNMRSCRTSPKVEQASRSNRPQGRTGLKVEQAPRSNRSQLLNIQHRGSLRSPRNGWADGFF